ncbi:uncharacterized protein B0H64DRAFT_233332 [Chaetomium fimeti]|jgi:hypothetical protein|uniref:Uncharacterized protein n=1 Tax=Chaetomium fimeti TaxID=1854472 RepID=A0AAE0HBP0_9PEZI|nr:hypothetical protein B0H64DRAFT_233332 [Chaetomium fimeti]
MFLPVRRTYGCLLACWQKESCWVKREETVGTEREDVALLFIIIAWHGMAWHGVVCVVCDVVVLWHGHRDVDVEVSIKRNGPTRDTHADGLKGMDDALGEWNLTAANHASSEASSGLGAFFFARRRCRCRCRFVARGVLVWRRPPFFFRFSFSGLVGVDTWFFSVCPALSLVLVPTEVRAGLVIMANGNGFGHDTMLVWSTCFFFFFLASCLWFSSSCVV